MTILWIFWNIYLGCQSCLLNLHYVVSAQMLCPSSLWREMLMRLVHGHEQQDQSSGKYREARNCPRTRQKMRVGDWEVASACRLLILSSGVFHNAVSLNKSLWEDKENVLIFDSNIGIDFPMNIPVLVCLLILSAKANLWLCFLSGMSYMLQNILGKVNYEWYLKAELYSHITSKALSLDGTFRWEANITNNRSKRLSCSPVATQLIPSTLQIVILLKSS